MPPVPGRGSAGQDRFEVLVARAGRALSTVLVLGETGVGKERVARGIHGGEATRDGPWVAVNCAALPPELVESLLFGHVKGAFTGAEREARGKIREAHGGTLFLDEVGELPLPVQAKLLRVLQEREVEPLGGRPEPVRLRVVAATHRDLPTEVAAGRFREDLLYRLSVITIRVPPLRERRQEIPGLLRELLPRVADRVGLPAPGLHPDLVDYLVSCRWPGNVRQLENLLEEMLVISEEGELGLGSLPRSFRKESFLEDFRLPDPVPVPLPESSGEDGLLGEGGPQGPVPGSPEAAPGSGGAPGEGRAPLGVPTPAEELLPGPSEGGLKERLEICEKRFLLRALEESGGHKARAAEALGITPRAMSYYLRKHGL